VYILLVPSAGGPDAWVIGASFRRDRVSMCGCRAGPGLRHPKENWFLLRQVKLAQASHRSSRRLFVRPTLAGWCLVMPTEPPTPDPKPLYV
jgi:hypothetical protein